MSWFDEQGLKGWYSRISGKRKELSESVEETLNDTSVQNEGWEDEDEIEVPHSKDTSLIPPRLSLQSKQFPAIRPALPGSARSDSPAAEYKRSGNLSTAVLPATETAHAMSGNQRLAGRSTKVRLQIVSKLENTPLPVEARAASQETEGLSRLSAVNLLESMHNPTQTALAGSGKFEADQSDAAVLNANITSTSVILVTLTSDPGPVVAKYVSLQPGLGFTVHLTAPTQNFTSFNYAILNGG